MSSEKGQQAMSAAVDTVQTMSRGEAPSNAQLNATLDSTQQALEQRRREANLNERGDLLAKDTSRILEKTKQLINEKNPDELMQQFFYHSKQASLEAKTKAMNLKDEAPLDSSDAKDIQAQAEDIIYVARRVSYEVLKSKEFRRLLLDTVELIQGIFWRKVNKEGTQLSNALKSDIAEGNTDMSKTSSTASYVSSKLSTDVQQGQLMTEDEKHQLTDRLRRILQKIAQNPDYHRAVNGIFTLLDQLKVKADQVKEDPNVQKTVEKSSENANLMWQDVKTMFERFSGAGTIDPILNSLRNLYKMIEEDPRATAIFRDTRAYIREAMKNPTVLDDPSRRREWELVFDKSRSLFNDPKYNRYSSEIFDQITDLLNKIKEDEVSSELAASVRKFAQDLALDASGRPSLGALQDSMTQLKNLMMPVLLKQMEAIPIARIEGSTKKYDFVIDNIVFSAYDVLPDYLNLTFHSQLNVDMKELSTDKASAYVRLNLGNIKSHLRNLRFAYRKKTFPKIEDEGVADIDISGDGINLNVEWEIRSYGDEPMRFIVRDVTCDIDRMNVNIKQAQHSILDKMVTKLFSGTIKRSVEDEIETNIRYFGRYVADQMNDAFLNVSKPKSA